MNLQYFVKSDYLDLWFHVDQVTGSLIIEATDHDHPIEIPHKIAIELIEVLRSKLYDHQLESESLLKRLFK